MYLGIGKHAFLLQLLHYKIFSLDVTFLQHTSQEMKYQPELSMSMFIVEGFFFLTSLSESHIFFVISLMVLLLMFISSRIVTCGLNCFGICTIGWLFSTSLLYYIKILDKALTDLWIQQSQECPNQYKPLFHISLLRLRNQLYPLVKSTWWTNWWNLLQTSPSLLLAMEISKINIFP